MNEDTADSLHFHFKTITFLLFLILRQHSEAVEEE